LLGVFRFDRGGVGNTSRWAIKTMSSPRAADRDSWKNQPLPSQSATLSLNATYTLHDYERIKRGLIPAEMEDKWFIFFDDDIGFFHRSWTGVCIYEVVFQSTDQSVAVQSAKVNRDPEQYRSDDIDHDCELLRFLIDNLLLGKNTPFPLPSDLPKEETPGVYQHHVSGSGYRQKRLES
jgi:hypothetical protein